MKCEEAKILLSGLLDGELNIEEKDAITEHLEKCSDCLNEYSRLLKLKEVTNDMKYFDLPDKLWAGYWKGIYNKIERGLGWIFLSIGAIVLLAFGAFEITRDFFLDSKPPLLLKIGVTAVILGLIIMLISIIRERIFSRAHDRYEEVEI